MLKTRQMLPLLLAAAFISGCSSLPATEPDAGQAPLIVAHRGGAADFPENTLLAIDNALRNRADMLWLTVQLSRDGVPVLYRPADLSANTPASGAVSEKTLAQLQTLNAGWNFKQTAADGQVTFPFRSQAVSIPRYSRRWRRSPMPCRSFST